MTCDSCRLCLETSVAYALSQDTTRGTVGAWHKTACMYPDRVRRDALDRLECGQTLSRVSRDLGVSRAALRDWRAKPARNNARRCPRCDDTDLPPDRYAALLGYYLGDGCLSQAERYVALRICCDAKLPGIVGDVVDAVSAGWMPSRAAMRAAGSR